MISKLNYINGVLSLYFTHYIFSQKNKMLIGGFVLGLLGPLFKKQEWIDISNHIAYKVRSIPMNCELYKFENVPSYDLNDTLVTIVIPTRDHLKDLNKCIGSIVTSSTHNNYEIIVVNNQSDEYTVDWLDNCPYNILVFDYPLEYNYAAIHNAVIPHCSGEYIIMLNNDTEIIEPTWIEQLVGPMIDDPTIGMTGAKLLFADHTIQHCGVVYSEVIGGFMHVNSHKCDIYPRTNEPMIYPAVTGACVAIKRELYLDLGGMDDNLPIAYNDIDLCMKVNQANYKVLYTPYAKLYHYESKTRGYDTTLEKQLIEYNERCYFINKWGGFINATFK